MWLPQLSTVALVAFVSVVVPELWVLKVKMDEFLDEKKQVDEKLLQADHSNWYSVDLARLPADLQESFIQMSEDAETGAFLRQCTETTSHVLDQVYYKVARFLMKSTFTKTDINGLMNKTSMFVFSKAQFDKLLGVTESWKANNLLDLGAGSGGVTLNMARHYRDVYTTEISTPMTWRLQKHGFQLLDVDGWGDGSHRFDTIACLNLLDRCSHPLTMLRQIKQALQITRGRLVLGLVLPLDQHNEQDPYTRPDEKLGVRGKGWEAQAGSVWQHLLAPMGWRLHAFTRLPYISEGRLTGKPFYTLSEAVYVLSPGEVPDS